MRHRRKFRMLARQYARETKFRERKKASKVQQGVNALRRERRIENIRTRQLIAEMQRKQKSRRLRRYSQEQLLVNRLFEKTLQLQKIRLREKSKQDKEATRTTEEILSDRYL